MIGMVYNGCTRYTIEPSDSINDIASVTRFTADELCSKIQKIIDDERIKYWREEILNLAYPIGSVYYSVEKDPSLPTMGATWEYRGVCPNTLIPTYMWVRTK